MDEARPGPEGRKTREGGSARVTPGTRQDKNPAEIFFVRPPGTGAPEPADLVFYFRVTHRFFIS